MEKFYKGLKNLLAGIVLIIILCLPAWLFWHFIGGGLLSKIFFGIFLIAIILPRIIATISSLVEMIISLFTAQRSR